MIALVLPHRHHLRPKVSANNCVQETPTPGVLSASGVHASRVMIALECRCGCGSGPIGALPPWTCCKCMFECQFAIASAVQFRNAFICKCPVFFLRHLGIILIVECATD